MEKVINNFSVSVEAINLDIDNLAYIIFNSLLSECETAQELEDRIYQFDRYFDDSHEIARLKEVIGHQVRKKGKAFLDEIKAQNKIALGQISIP